MMKEQEKINGLTDLKCYDDWYYVGDIIDMDGPGWVIEEEAQKIIEEYNENLKHLTKL
jgi:hypothetical protein